MTQTPICMSKKLMKEKSYQRRFRGEDFENKILKGLNCSGEPSSWVEEMLQDIKQDKALVLVANGLKVGETGCSYLTEVRVFYPKLKEEVWKTHDVLKHFKPYELKKDKQ